LKSESLFFTLTILPVNYAPAFVGVIGNIEIRTGETLEVFFPKVTD